MAANWPVFRLWADLWPRWKMLAGMGGTVRLAMDLRQVESALRLAGVKRRRWPGIYKDLLEMEREAMKAMNEQA